MSVVTDQDVLRGVKNKDVRRLLRTSIRKGFRVTIDGGGHVRVVSPRGNECRVPKTSTNWHAFQRLRVFLKREGIVR